MLVGVPNVHPLTHLVQLDWTDSDDYPDPCSHVDEPVPGTETDAVDPHIDIIVFTVFPIIHRYGKIVPFDGRQCLSTMEILTSKRVGPKSDTR